MSCSVHKRAAYALAQHSSLLYTFVLAAIVAVGV